MVERIEILYGWIQIGTIFLVRYTLLQLYYFGARSFEHLFSKLISEFHEISLNQRRRVSSS